METQNRIDFATGELDRILEFFPRVESKASLLFAVDTAMLALVAINLQPHDIGRWYIAIPAALAVIAICAGVYFCYRCVFPSLGGGGSSLIYFREIAARTEANFISEFAAVQEGPLERDLLGQIWRNSEILTAKFDAIKIAFLSTAIALVPWTIFLATTAIIHVQLPVMH